MAGKDFYAILGVPKTASDDEIKKSFRRLAHEHHPDKGGDPQKFKDVNEAYQVIGDAEKRAQYDRFGSAAFEQGGFGGGSPFGGGFNGNINMEDLGDLGDIFGSMFGFQSRGGRQKKGRDIETDVAIDFAESVTGAMRTIELYKHVACAKCEGSGSEPGAKIETCKTCQGRGQVQRSAQTPFGVIQTAATCPECHGKGKIPSELCSACKGTGIERKTVKHEIRIPAGIADGETLRVAGEGEYPGSDGRKGDLFIHIRVEHDPRFSREGNDVHSTVHPPYSMLALGGEIQIDTIEGSGSLKIPEGTQPGTVFKLRHKGFHSVHGHGQGDHLVTVLPKVEKKLNKEQKQALDELRKKGL